MVFGMAQPERPRRRPQPSSSHVHVRTQMLDFESGGGVVMKSSLPCLEPPCEGVTNPCRTSQACRCRSFPFLSRPRLARRIPDSYVISGDFATLWEASSVSRWKQKTTSTTSFATWSGTPCVQTSWSERNRGVGRVCAVWIAKTRRFPSSRRGLCRTPPIGCKLSTNRKRKAKWRCCVAASIAVGPSAILTGSRTRPSDWGWNVRFGPVEGRRNNHRLVKVNCIIWILQIWWLSP